MGLDGAAHPDSPKAVPKDSKAASRTGDKSLNMHILAILVWGQDSLADLPH